MHLIFIATACFGLTKFRECPKIKCACLLSKASDLRVDIWAQIHSMVRDKMIGASSKGPDLTEEPDKTTRMANTLPCKVVFDLGGGSWSGASKNKERDGQGIRVPHLLWIFGDVLGGNILPNIVS